MACDINRRFCRTGISHTPVHYCIDCLDISRIHTDQFALQNPDCFNCAFQIFAGDQRPRRTFPVSGNPFICFNLHQAAYRMCDHPKRNSERSDQRNSDHICFYICYFHHIFSFKLFAPHFSQKWHAHICPFPISFNSGFSVLQISFAIKQRVWNTQPEGGFAGLGRSPWSRILLRLLCRSGRGIEYRSA